MDVREALIFADDVVFAKTGKHLDDLQVGVIEGVLKRQKYGEMAQEFKCTEAYAKDVGYELWQLLSEVFGEEVNKSNLRSALLRHQAFNNSSPNIFGHGNVGGSGNIIRSINVCTSKEESPEFLLGKQEAKVEVAVRLREMGLSDEQIAQCLQMKIEEVQQLFTE